MTTISDSGMKLISVLGVAGIAYLLLWIWCIVDITHRQFARAKAHTAWLWTIVLIWPVSYGIGYVPYINVLAPIIGICGIITLVYYLIAARYKHGVNSRRPIA